ncbi:pyridoxal-phosphate dependent enzyme [Facklamia hominis]|uniref:pyridoxal-phosphate dependent enzyme n=1 Tax=Facklamia hominis TaxID=178214 RepID=UPI0038FCAE29
MDNFFNTGETSIKSFDKLENEIYIKCEDENPTGSIKDRSIWYMIKDIIDLNNEDQTLIHFVIASSGNAGISLAYLCQILGHECTIFVSKNIEKSKMRILNKLGANVRLCSGEKSTFPGGWVYESIKFYNELITANKYYIDQFDNSLNIEAHFDSTAPEIFSFFEKQSVQLDYIFLGIGSGGTAAGIQKYIDKHNQLTKVIICDPVGGIIYDAYNGNKMIYEDHNIEAISDSFIPNNITNIHQFYDVIRMEDKILIDGRRQLLLDAQVLAGDVASFVYASIIEYIKTNNLKGKSILLLNTEEGFR